MRSILATASMALNRISGGERGQYLCARIAVRWGANCKFCKLLGALLREPSHCADQLSDWLRKK